MAFSTVLTPTAGVPGRSYGGFTGKGGTPAPPAGGGKTYSVPFTALTPTGGLPGRRYGSFAGKGAAPEGPAGGHSGIFTALTPTAGLPGKRYGSFAGKGDVPAPPTPTPTTTQTGGHPRRKRAFVDGKLVEGRDNIRAALTDWTRRLEAEAARPKGQAPKPRTIKTRRAPVDIPPTYTLTEADVETFATALRAIEAKEAEVKAFLAEWRRMVDEDEAWLILQ